MKTSDLPVSAACERNKEPILTQLRQHIRKGDKVLEVGSGTGEHAVFFAENLPHITWQASDRLVNLPIIQTRIKAAQLPNLLAAKILDVNDYAWEHEQYNLVFSANTLHIMSESEANCLLLKVAKGLKPRGKLMIYGPFRYPDFTSKSNAVFHQYLKSIDPKQGIRDFHKINALLISQGFVLLEDQVMPANNQCITWQLS